MARHGDERRGDFLSFSTTANVFGSCYSASPCCPVGLRHTASGPSGKGHYRRNRPISPGFTLIDVSAAAVRQLPRVIRAVTNQAPPVCRPRPPVSLSSGDILRVRISETKEGGIFAPLVQRRHQLRQCPRRSQGHDFASLCRPREGGRARSRSASKTGCGRASPASPSSLRSMSRSFRTAAPAFWSAAK